MFVKLFHFRRDIFDLFGGHAGKNGQREYFLCSFLSDFEMEVIILEVFENWLEVTWYWIMDSCLYSICSEVLSKLVSTLATNRIDMINVMGPFRLGWPYEFINIGQELLISRSDGSPLVIPTWQMPETYPPDRACNFAKAVVVSNSLRVIFLRPAVIS